MSGFLSWFGWGAAEEPKKGCPAQGKIKPCCACPETKSARDECIVLNGEENCGELIEAHKRCMRSYGFEV